MDLAQNYDHLNADDEVHRAICKIIRMVGVSLWVRHEGCRTYARRGVRH